jgi:hypothetical protein
MTHTNNPTEQQATPAHTTHHACDEIMQRDGGKAIGCCCTGHECRATPTSEEELREKLTKNIRVIKGYPSSGLAMQFHVPDSPDGENYILQIDKEFWQEIVKEVNKAKLETISLCQLKITQMLDPSGDTKRELALVSVLEELSKLQEEQ